MSNKSGTSAQAITLPKGGGALQGIGETFSPDLFTGTGNATVPIALPPGRHGFQPQLSLLYSTGNGNGSFGLGWDLSVPGVTRKTSKGIPRYRDAGAEPDERDTFILSGAEDLVPVAESAPAVTRFQPRTEGLFARIERVQSAGDDFWRVRSKDGLVSLFGTPTTAGGDPAVVANPAVRAKIFCWKLAQTTDPFGNRIDYQYLRDRGSDGSHDWDQIYLQNVQYADYEQNGETRYLVSVTFVYEQRPDPFSTYRAGFEIRTRLRCKQIEIRTHADQDRLTRSYELVYLDERVRAGELPPASLPANGVSLLSKIQVIGHDGDQTEALPALEFGYTRFAPEQQRFQPITAVNNALPPRSLADSDFEMVDLFGNGLPDIVQMNGSVLFWRNLGGGVFDRPQAMDEVPAGTHLRDPGVQFADMNGDGRADLLVLPQQGYFPLSFQGRWSPQGFVQYAQAPNLNFGDNTIRLVDLDGDGVIDALRTSVEFELFFNDPRNGWQTVETRPRGPGDEFPDVQFSDPRVKLADLSGDNLQDIVFIEQGRIDYWPYLGYGEWGRRITMSNSPVFEDAPAVPDASFDPRRVLLGDLDGDGLDDLVYVEVNRLTFWINQGGERWSDPITITGTPTFTDVDAVRLVDMLGTGMAGVLWTFDQLAGTGSNFQFLDLTGSSKPYLLETMDNHRGAITHVHYAASTKFYLADVARPQTRWKTPLPFPVLVVEQVEVIDAISKGKLTTEYSYHHGYWDGAEREFRGFGRVEQRSSETFDVFNRSGLHGDTTDFNRVQSTHFSPPTLTKTWFHLGAIGDEFQERQEADFSGEYFPEDPAVLERPQPTIALLQALAGRPRADALRALRGSILRTELYALDGSDREQRPYTVTESQYGLRAESMPAEGDHHRQPIFFPHPVAQRTTQSERGNEPMTSFSFTSDYDPYGLPKQQLAIAVPRGRNPLQTLNAPTQPYLSTYTSTEYAQRDNAEFYMVDRVAQSTSYEVVNDGKPSVFALYNAVLQGVGALRVIGHTRTFYDGEAFAGLPIQQLGRFGARVRSETLVFTDDFLDSLYDPNDALKISPRPAFLDPQGATVWPDEYPDEFRTLLPTLGGHIHYRDGDVPSSPSGYYVVAERYRYDFHDPARTPRGLPLVTRDPLGADTTFDYDAFGLLPTRVTDPVGLATEASYDYRVLQASEITDPNSNIARFAFSPAGFLVAQFIRGKPGEGDGANPSVRMEYDLLAFSERRQPIFVRSIRRVHHDSEIDVPPEQRDATITSIEYSDGFGRLLQTRTQADDVLFGEPVFGGNVISTDQSKPIMDTAGRARQAGEPDNVVVSGWQVYDNKGRVVEKYQPFFAKGYAFSAPSDAQLGQKATLFYDPRGQVIRTINPDGSEQRVVLGIPSDLTDPEQYTPTAWETYTYDPNDSAGRTHGDAAAAYHAHWNTPSSMEVDGLGRTVTAVVRNGADPAKDWYTTRSHYDIQGNLVSITDALGREAFRYTFDLAKRCWRADSIDAGRRDTVPDALGNPIEGRDSKGAVSLHSYDLLHRPVRLWARDDAIGPVTLRQRMEYGDGGQPDQSPIQREAARAGNLLGQLTRHHDEAGLTTVAALDFKGNLIDKAYRVIADAPILAVFDQAPANSWHIAPFQVDWQPAPQQMLADREGELLETTAYRATSSYDALNRVKRMQFPQDVQGQRHELKPKYNRAGTLEQVWLDDTLYVERIAYDAKGQRALIAYGNGVMTRYGYDPQTFRLKRLRSERYTKPDTITYHPSGEALQDYCYDYDLVGNMLGIQDRAPGSGILNNPAALSAGDPALAQLLASGDVLDRRFEYDPIYRLLSATGRECARPSDSQPFDDQPRCTDLTRTRAYTERYVYDPMGNILHLEHRSDQDGFIGDFTMEASSNRLREMTIGDTLYAYTFDANGNMRSETTSRHFEWNHADQMKVFRTQTNGAEPSVYAHYLYDAAGQRVKKLVRKQGGQVEVTHYIGAAFEHHRWGSGAQAGENNYVHVMDDQQRVALVRFGNTHPQDSGPTMQFQLGDHLGSSNVVVDSGGVLINREEFTPYGETSFGSFARKRYRYTGKERDDESGLNYHGARYYLPWLARWASCDPLGGRAGLNLYDYGYRRPLVLTDRTGKQPDAPGVSGVAGTRQTEPLRLLPPVSPTYEPEPVSRPDDSTPDSDNIEGESHVVEHIKTGMEATGAGLTVTEHLLEHNTTLAKAVGVSAKGAHVATIAISIGEFARHPSVDSGIEVGSTTVDTMLLDSGPEGWAIYGVKKTTEKTGLEKATIFGWIREWNRHAWDEDWEEGAKKLEAFGEHEAERYEAAVAAKQHRLFWSTQVCVEAATCELPDEPKTEPEFGFSSRAPEAGPAYPVSELPFGPMWIPVNVP